jgi:small subunit ribosomal protein S16
LRVAEPKPSKQDLFNAALAAADNAPAGEAVTPKKKAAKKSDDAPKADEPAAEAPAAEVADK